jgi:hypothetical protein
MIWYGCYLVLLLKYIMDLDCGILKLVYWFGYLGVCISVAFLPCFEMGFGSVSMGFESWFIPPVPVGVGCVEILGMLVVWVWWCSPVLFCAGRISVWWYVIVFGCVWVIRVSCGYFSYLAESLWFWSLWVLVKIVFFLCWPTMCCFG